MSNQKFTCKIFKLFLLLIIFLNGLSSNKNLAHAKIKASPLGGITFGAISASEIINFSAFSEQGGTSLVYGLLLEYPGNQKISYELGVFHYQRTWKREEKTVDASDNVLSHKISKSSYSAYTFPLSLRFRVSESFFASLGGYLTYGTGLKKTKGTLQLASDAPTPFESEEPLPDELEIDYGVQAGLSYLYKLNNSFFLRFEARGLFGLDQNKDKDGNKTQFKELFALAGFQINF